MSNDEPHWQAHPGNGPHLLLIHGFLSSRAQWQPNLDALCAFCQPVVMELYGHGRSPAPVDGARYRPDGYARAIEGIREQLGAEAWFVCGYSLGAAISAHYAMTHPQRVLGHVITNSTSAFAGPELIKEWHDRAEDSAHSFRSHGRAAIEAMAIHPKNAKRLPPSVQAALVEDTALIDPEGIAQAMQHTMPNASVREVLKNNPVPALLVCGRFERRFAPHREYAASAVPNLRVVDVDAGHGVNMEAADAFNAALRDFIHEHGPG